MMTKLAVSDVLPALFLAMHLYEPLKTFVATRIVRVVSVGVGMCWPIWFCHMIVGFG